MTDARDLPETSTAQEKPLTASQWGNLEVQHLHEDLIAKQIPAWFKDTSVLMRDTLRKTMLEWHTTQAEIAKVFADIKPIEQFAEPLLKAALVANGWTTINPKSHGFKQVRLLSNAVLFISNQQTKLVDSLAKFLLPESLIPSSLEVNLVSSTSHHDLLQAALQNFEVAETVKGGFDTGTAIYGVQKNVLVDLPEYEPEKFARICRELNLGKKYQDHLGSVFTPVDNAFAITDQRSKGFKLKSTFVSNKRLEFVTELQVAYMKSHVTVEHYDFIQATLLNHNVAAQTIPNLHSTLKLMGFEVAGVIILWPDKRPAGQRQRCIVYMPQAPQRAFYAFDDIDKFKVELREWLTQREFADYFMKLVPLRYRAEFIRRTDLKKVAWDSLLLLRPPIIYEPAIFNECEVIAQLSNPFEKSWELQLAQIKDDARLLVIPTEDEDSKSRLERQAALWNAGLSALTLALGFVPVVGEFMLLFGVVQLGADIFEGIEAWERNDKVAALKHLFDVAQNLSMVAVPGVAKSLSSSTMVNRLTQITRSNGQKRLWKADLKPYERRPEILTGLKPDAQGLYHLEGVKYLQLEQKVYQVQGDVSRGYMSIDPVRNPDGYSPLLRHNGSGAWTHEFDAPMQWSRLKLFKRLGPDTELFSDATAELILLLTGTTEGELRAVYIDTLPSPPLLADCIKRMRLSQQIEYFSSQMLKGVYATSDFAPMQLELLPQLSGWPTGQGLRVVDLPRGTFKDFGVSPERAYSRTEISQARINKGELLDATLETLSETQIETLLGEPVTGTPAQSLVLARKLGSLAHTSQRTLVSSLYAADTVLEPALKNISKQFPGLPVNVLEELINHLTQDELSALTYRAHIPLRAAEEARIYAQRLRLNRAIEGIACQALSSADSQTLAWKTIAQLPGWPKKVTISVRSSLNNEQISVIEGETGSSRREIFKKGELYEFSGTSAEQPFTSPDLTACVFKSLTDNERNGLNSGTTLSYSDFMSRVAMLAAKQRDSSASALGMQPIKPWFKSPMRLADGRMGYTLGGRSGHQLDASKPLALKELVQDIYPNMSETQIGHYLYRLQQTPIQAASELVRLKAELDLLRKTLQDWEEASVWSYPFRGQRTLVSVQTKRAMSRALIRAWRRLSTPVSLEGAAGYELDLNGWPVDALPPLEADFRHILSLHLSNTTSTVPASFLEKFTELRHLSLNTTQLTELPASIATMPELTHLNLRNNQIVLTPESANILSAKTKLKTLVLTGNPLGRNFSVQHMPQLQHLMLRYTGLSEWPTGIGILNDLQTLDLRNNSISFIPSAILTESMASINRVTSLHDNPLTPDSTRRLGLYRDSQQITLGMVDVRQHVSRIQGIKQWAVEPTAEQSSVWNALLREPGAGDFFAVIEDLSTSSQFANARVDLTLRVWTLLKAANDSTQLRSRLFTLAGQLSTCGDGIAMVFAELELEHLVFLAEHSEQGESAMLKLARGLFRIEMLNKHVLSIIKARIDAIHATQSEYVQQLQELVDATNPDLASRPLADMSAVEQQGVAYRLESAEGMRLAELLSPGSVEQQIRRLDPLEIQMFYHVNLASPLELPARPTSMRFGNIANVSATDLDTAKRYVLDQEQVPALVHSISGQGFWSDYLQKKKPESFTAVMSKYQEMLDEVYSKRATLSSDEYRQEAERVGKERKQAIADVIEQLTQMELKTNVVQAPVVPGETPSPDI
ncbi:NEL-type E3 ubiquitin ligase domain-containing protein [Pseudomonas sp. FSL R10-1350]|uniref:NEL-type E3 ubiquitin ligase domain-containing protein n=1 Tax=Pseudomonas sp. FSL R10-1350 TaxID=2662197 RepID=UPI0015B46FE5|nr:NEL-type E3 ubiquitin ligase domain-containing protein [Pseudomonas sp. FSL R10-1350]